MAGTTIDLFPAPPSSSYADADLFGLGQGAAPTPTYKGNLLDLYKYMQRKPDQSPNNPYGQNLSLINGTLVATVAANNLTVALKTFSGGDPSAADPVAVIFRDSTIAGGSYVVRKITAAVSFTVNNGQTLGTSSGVAFELILVGINDTAFQLGLVNPDLNTGLRYVNDEYALKSSTGGNGGANAGIIYSPTSATNKQIVNLAILRWSSGLGTAGTWASAPTYIQRITASSLYAKLQEEANARINADATKLNLSGSSAMTGRLTITSVAAGVIDKGTVGSGTVTFDASAGSRQRLQVSGSLTIAFTGWPASGINGEVVIELVNGGSGTITWPTVRWYNGDGTLSTTFSTMGVSLQTGGFSNWITVWTTNGGTNLNGRAM